MRRARTYESEQRRGIPNFGYAHEVLMKSVTTLASTIENCDVSLVGRRMRAQARCERTHTNVESEFTHSHVTRTHRAAAR